MPMDDPYKVLGVSPSASEEEITRAYRALAKKYHPDLNPGDKSAEQKMRQVNAAYEEIKNNKHGGATYERQDGSYGRGPDPNAQRSYGGGDPYGGFGGFEDFFGGYEEFFSGQGAGAQQLRAVQQAIDRGQYAQALTLLSHIGSRDAEWYYLSAIANAGLNNRVTALNHAAEAARMAPNNLKYQSLLRQFQQGSYEYRQTGQNYGFDMSRMGSTLIRLFLAQMLCMCCCRGC